MIPLRDDAPVAKTAWVTTALMAVNLLVFVFELTRGPRIDALVFSWGLLPSELIRWWTTDRHLTAHAPLTLLTAQFLHAGWLHLASNLLFLWIFGDNVEDRFGRLGFILFALIGGAVGFIAQVIASGPVATPIIGASGAISAILGAYIVLYPRAHVEGILPIAILVPWVRVPALAMFAIWFLFQFVHGIATLLPASGPIEPVAWWTHIAGFLFGTIMTPFWPKSPPPVALTPVTRPRPQPLHPWARVVSLALTGLQWLLLIRFGLIFCHYVGPSALGYLLGITLLVTDVFVEPFGRFKPQIMNGFVVETATLVAIGVTRLLELTSVWTIDRLAQARARRRAAGPVRAEPRESVTLGN